MLEKLQAVENRYEELCFRSEQADFYNDPKKAAAFLREKNDLEPIIEAFRAYKAAEREMADAGYGMALVSTQVDEDAQHFYRKQGWRDCGCLVLGLPGFEQPMEMFLARPLKKTF